MQGDGDREKGRTTKRERYQLVAQTTVKTSKQTSDHTANSNSPKQWASLRSSRLPPLLTAIEQNKFGLTGLTFPRGTSSNASSSFFPCPPFPKTALHQQPAPESCPSCRVSLLALSDFPQLHLYNAKYWVSPSSSRVLFTCPLLFLS